MTNTEHTMDPAAGIEALTNQLHDCEDAIGRIAVTWRQAASNPAAMEVAAERMTVLERQRDLLRKALEDAGQAQAHVDANSNAARVQELVAAAREQVAPLLDARVEKGRQLEEAVLRVAALVQELHDQAQEIRREWPAAAQQASEVGPMHECFRALDSADMHTSIGQMLAWRLGRLWGEERSPANRDESVAQRIEHEVSPIRYAFEQGVKRCAAGLLVSAA